LGLILHTGADEVAVAKNAAKEVPGKKAKKIAPRTWIASDSEDQESENEEDSAGEEDSPIVWAAGDPPMVMLDLVFCVDCTGSMGSYIRTVQKTIKRIVKKIIFSERADVRFALVMYRDYPPQELTFATQVCTFTSELGEMQNYVNKMQAHGGGDTAECMATGLHESSIMDYRTGATSVCVLIADAPPHGMENNVNDGFPEGDPGDFDLMRISNSFIKDKIRVYSVGCDDLRGFLNTRCWAKWLSERSGGKYVPLTDAKLLDRVIIGGCREELQLDKLSKEVLKELEILKIEKGDIEDIPLADVAVDIHSRLSSRGLTIAQLQGGELSDGTDMTSVYKLLDNAGTLHDAANLLRQFVPQTQSMYDNNAETKKSVSVNSVDVPVSIEHVQKILKFWM